MRGGETAAGLSSDGRAVAVGAGGGESEVGGGGEVVGTGAVGELHSGATCALAFARGGASAGNVTPGVTGVWGAVLFTVTSRG
jgi:hypothetical protein